MSIFDATGKDVTDATLGRRQRAIQAWRGSSAYDLQERIWNSPRNPEALAAGGVKAEDIASAKLIDNSTVQGQLAIEAAFKM